MKIYKPIHNLYITSNIQTMIRGFQLKELNILCEKYNDAFVMYLTLDDEICKIGFTENIGEIIKSFSENEYLVGIKHVEHVNYWHSFISDILIKRNKIHAFKKERCYSFKFNDTIYDDFVLYDDLRNIVNTYQKEVAISMNKMHYDYLILKENNKHIEVMRDKEIELKRLELEFMKCNKK